MAIGGALLTGLLVIRLLAPFRTILRGIERLQRGDFATRLPRLHATTFPESWRVWSELTGVALPPAVLTREFAHNHSMIEAAASGMGVAIAPWAFVAPDVTAGRLVAPYGFAERPSQFVFLRPAGRKDAAADAFRDWLVAEGAASPPPPSHNAP